MFSWGIVLMVVGGLSFVLPIFGRQFIIVSALGLTGIGSAMAGIVLFVIGILLFNAARNKEQLEHPVPRSANYEVPQLIPASSSKATEPANVASPPLAQNNAPSFNMGNVSCQTQANTTTPSASPTKTHMNGMLTRLINPSEKSKDSPLNMVNQTPNEGHLSERDLDMSEQSQSGHHLFISESGEQLNPKQYGLTVVTIAVDTTIGMVKGIIDNGETKIQKAISANAEGVHLHFIALHAAIYYLYAAKFLTIPETEIQKGILREISEGILIGFNETISNN